MKNIFDSKKLYYSEYFAINLKNLKKIWSGINDILSIRKGKEAEAIFLNDEDGITTDQKQVADSFNKYFTNVAKNLVSKLGNPNTKYQDYLKNPKENTIYLGGIDPGEVSDLIANLDVSKSGDIYGITPFLVKVGCDELVSPL